MADGARDALLGFLYQVVGLASLRARSGETAAGGASADLLARVGSGTLLHEVALQDGLVRHAGSGSAEATAIQFKHTGTSGLVIDTDELQDILHRFELSRRADESIIRFALITNRAFDGKVQDAFDNRKTTPRPTILLINPTRAGQPTEKSLRLLKDYGGDRDKAADAWSEILQRLEYYPANTYSTGLAELQAFANAHGVLPHEMEEHLDRLIGALMVQTRHSQDLEISKAWLNQHLIGPSDAASLKFSSARGPAHVLTRAENRLKDWVSSTQVALAPRDALTEIQAHLAVSPVLFIAGNGGCGKSVVAMMHLLGAATNHVCLFLGLNEGSEVTFGREFTKLRSPTEPHLLPDDRLTVAVSRLRAANPGTPIVLVAHVDAIDERPLQDSKHGLRTLISSCWSEGRYGESGMNLIITFRPEVRWSAAQIGKICRHWFPGKPEALVRNTVGFVVVDDFTDGELRAAARLRTEDDAPERRLRQELDGDSATIEERGLPDIEPVERQSIDALKHPLIWGHYASLSSTLRGAVLSGDRPALAILAGKVLESFRAKCSDRRDDLSDENEVKCALQKIAAAANGVPPFSKVLWHAQCQGPLGQSQAQHLFQEAVTYGVIEQEEPETWRWKHAFIARFLRDEH